MRSFALVALAGCSFATTGAPARHDARAALDCTTSSALPVIDASATILAGVIGVPLLLAGGGCDGDGDCHDDPPTRSFGTLFAVTGVVYAFGAYVGFSNVSSCKAAIARSVHQRAPNSVAP